MTQPSENLVIDAELETNEREFREAPDGRGRRPRSRGQLILRRFLRNRLAIIALILFIAMFAWSFIGPHFNATYKGDANCNPAVTPGLPGYDHVCMWDYKRNDFSSFLDGPSSKHFFGTTQSGQDVYAQLLRGMQKSMVIGLLAAVMTTAIASIVGSVAAYFGGFVDRILMWVVDMLLVVPAFLIIAILSPLFQGSTWLLLVVLIAIFAWMVTARAIRSQTLSLREREYVTAARYMGVRPARIIARHVLPNIASYLIVDVTLNVGAAIITEVSLSYFGFGIQPPDVSLGTLLQAGQDKATTAWWLFAFCGGALTLIVLCVNFVGDGLRDAFDPGSATSRAR